MATRGMLLAFLLLLLLPLAGLFAFTLTANGGVTLAPYAVLLKDPVIATSFAHSFFLSAAAALLVILVVTPALFVAHRFYPALVPLLEGLSFLPFAIPGVVLALGDLQVFDNGPLAQSPLLLPPAFAFLALPYFTRALLNNLEAIDAQTLADAGETLGCRLHQTFLRIILPNLVPGLVSGSLLVFTYGMGEFALTQLLTGGSYATFPVAMEEIFQNSPTEGGVMAVLSFLLTWALLAGITWVAGGPVGIRLPRTQMEATQTARKVS